MPINCAYADCPSNLYSIKHGAKNEYTSSFRFPLGKPDLLKKWIAFTMRADFQPSTYSSLCCTHFEDRYIFTGPKLKRLNWKLNPVPTIHTATMTASFSEKPSLEPTVVPERKPPTNRRPKEEKLHDRITSIDDINENHCPEGFRFDRKDDCILMYNLTYDSESFPIIYETIKIKNSMNVQLQYNGSPIPLPAWFSQGTDCSLKYFSQLENFPSHIRTFHDGSLRFPFIDELNERRNMHSKGKSPPYSAELLRYAMLLRHTSAQSYRLLLKKFPLPSFSLLEKLHKGGVDAVKAITALREENKISKDIVLMLDEMYLQKQQQYFAGELIGADEDDNLYKGIVCFMVAGLKQSVPYVVKTCPEIKIEGEWLKDQILTVLASLTEAGFNVRAVVADNHSTNVSAFKQLLKDSSDGLSFLNPQSQQRIYCFYDNVHLIKNIRNNLLNSLRFVFPGFSFTFGDGNSVNLPDGYIAWNDPETVHRKDSNLTANLRKARDLNYSALHPLNKKQNVRLALAVFSESTIAAVRSYMPERKDAAGFLTLIHTWWTVVNSGKRFHPNQLGNAIIKEDRKTEFMRELALWFESCRTRQNSASPSRHAML